MKILVADDEPVQRRLVGSILQKAGHEIVEAVDGSEALGQLASDDGPTLAVLDWMMPGMNGIDICRAIQDQKGPRRPYLILLTYKNHREEIVSGLEAGADDYIVKPFNPSELRARVQVGCRILGLQDALAERVAALEQALEHVNQLQRLLPMCAWCHKIRDDQNYWQSVEAYIAGHSDIRVTHTICPDCHSAVNETIRQRAQENGG
jgi:DNA-binding response OmpR family regulator